MHKIGRGRKKANHIGRSSKNRGGLALFISLQFIVYLLAKLKLFGMSVDEEDPDDLSNLFTCEDYVEKTWPFGDNFNQRLLCSTMSSVS
jgi:hypothetical protein